MTSATGDPRAFSLLELIISLSLIALLSTFFFVRFSDDPVERELTESASALKQFAGRGSRLASAFRTTQSINLDPQSLSLWSGPESSEPFLLPSGIRLELRRLHDREFRPVAESGESWQFESTGLVEPLGVRFSKAGAYIELEFNPLTATAETERSYFPE